MSTQNAEKSLKIATIVVLLAAIWGSIGVILSTSTLLQALPNPEVDIYLKVAYGFSLVLNIVIAAVLFVSYPKLKKRDDKARVMVLWITVPLLLSIPIGTLIAIIIWAYLRKPEVKALFQSSSIPQPETTTQSQDNDPGPPAQGPTT